MRKIGLILDSSDGGHATDHHFVWTGSMAQRGWQGIMLEATAVTPEGRISPEDAVSAHIRLSNNHPPHTTLLLPYRLALPP